MLACLSQLPDSLTPGVMEKKSREEWGRGQRYRVSYKNTVYERLSSNMKSTKKSHPVWRSRDSVNALVTS